MSLASPCLAISLSTPYRPRRPDGSQTIVSVGSRMSDRGKPDVQTPDPQRAVDLRARELGHAPQVERDTRLPCTALNQDVSEDRSLGGHYRIGHSYVTPPDGASGADGAKWFRQVVGTEIGPLLEEYWYDARDKAEQALSALDALSSRLTEPDLAHRCRMLAGDLGRLGVSGVRPSRASIVSDQIDRHDADDRLMVELARLVFDLMLPTEDAGD